MLKITSVQDNQNGLKIQLSGNLTEEYVQELEFVLSKKPAALSTVSLDLADVTFVDRAAMLFLCAARTRNISIENCPSYVSRWIEQEGVCSEPVSTRGSLAEGERRN